MKDVVSRQSLSSPSALFFLLLSAALFAFAAPATADPIADGDALYEKRAEGHSGDWAKTDNIKAAVEAYKKVWNGGQKTSDLAIKIMRANYFHGTFAEKDNAKQMEIFESSIKIGEEALLKDPNNAGLNYQMAGAWGRWGEVFGLIASARKGVADKVREYGEKTVKIDPAYGEGGGYRTLGRLHFKAPYIPLVLSWPDKEESRKFLRMAVEKGPNNPTNHLFYAETLYNLGAYKEAKAELDIVINAQPRPDHVVEDLRDQKDAKSLLTLVAGKIK
jgi:tetratricopeptide (TPR) repeat protein